jgi:hypothetical protein
MARLNSILLPSPENLNRNISSQGEQCFYNTAGRIKPILFLNWSGLKPPKESICLFLFFKTKFIMIYIYYYLGVSKSEYLAV